MLDNVRLHYVDSVETAGEFLTWLSERRPFLAVDTETTGFDWWTPDFLRLVQFGDGEQGWSVSARDWRGLLHTALSRLREDAAATSWLNVKFDLHALESADLPLPVLANTHDVGTMHRLLDPLGQHGLKPIARSLFGRDAVAGQDMLNAAMRDNGWTWATVPTDLPAYWAYAALDTVLTAKAAEVLHPQVTAEAPLSAAYDREMAVQAIMYGAECRGMRIDVDYTQELRAAWFTEELDLERLLQENGIKNPKSNIQIAVALKDAGWEPEEFTETGLVKVDQAILGELADSYGNLAPSILRYKRLSKWRASYLDKFLLKRDADDKIHASINTAGARTGRMTVTGIGLQTFPRGPDVRACIIPDEGHAIYSIDYDQMEMKGITHFSQDPGLLETAQSGEDLYTYTASGAYDVDAADVTKDQRDTSKNATCAYAYGGGVAKIAATAGVSETQVSTFLRAFDARFPGVKDLKALVDRTGKIRLAETGEAFITTTGGRRIPCDPDKTYTLVNRLVQGSCADVFKDALIRLDAAGFGDNIIVPVHDEVLFQFPIDGGEQMAQEACSIMEDRETFSVPLTCGLDGPLPSWGAKYA